eukprot:10161782-Heterocapsa_arctica.AAC.1
MTKVLPGGFRPSEMSFGRSGWCGTLRADRDRLAPHARGRRPEALRTAPGCIIEADAMARPPRG